MKIRTYYWHDKVISRTEFLARKILRKRPYNYFRIGNAGDILTDLLIQRVYGCASVNVQGQGQRLLLTGSVAHRMLDGDLLCGIGIKERSIPTAAEVQVRAWALRGPITYECFKASGHDVRDVKFLLDPGLMIRFMMSERLQSGRSHGAAFIPHYRERNRHLGRLPKGIRVIDIDDHPLNVGKAICGADLIYTSSLHGIIFAHALKRPAVFVQPQTGEPLLKYEDYFASVGLQMPRPLESIYNADFLNAPVSPATLNYQESDFVFPDLATLRSSGIAI